MANLDEVEDDDSSDANWLTEPSPLESSLARQDLKMLHESLKVSSFPYAVEASYLLPNTHPLLTDQGPRSKSQLVFF